MNGSDNAAGRQSPASSLPRAAVSDSPGERKEISKQPRRVLCVLCRIARHPQASCEHPRRILEVLERKEPERLFIPQQPNDRVCKDCCVVALDGHDCLWWDLCWRR